MFPVGEFFLQLIPEWFANYTAFLIAIIGIFFLLVYNAMINSKDRRNFRLVLIVLIIASCVENVNHCLADVDLTIYPNTQYIRTLFAILTLCFRPIITMFLFISVVENRKSVGKWVWIPAALAITLLLCDLVPGNQYFYVDTNQTYVWVKDYAFIGIFIYIITYLYLGGVVVASILRYRIKNFGEGTAILIVFLLVVAGYILQDVLANNTYYEDRVYGLGTQAASVGAFFIYVLYIMKNASIDPLTGLANRQSYTAELDKNNNKISAVIVVDMNGLKKLNDECGHARGDDALVYISKGIKDALKKGANAYRTGGDEFVVLCQNMDFMDVDDIVDDIQNNINVRGVYNVAIGYAIKKEDWQDGAKLIAEADKVMYQNKTAVKEAQKEAILRQQEQEKEKQEEKNEEN